VRRARAGYAWKVREGSTAIAIALRLRDRVAARAQRTPHSSSMDRSATMILPSSPSLFASSSLLRQAGDGDDFLAFGQVDQAHALRVAADDGDAFDGVRMTLAAVVISMMSSSSGDHAHADDETLLSVVFMVMMPLPPRRVRRVSRPSPCACRSRAQLRPARCAGADDIEATTLSPSSA